MTRSLLSVSSVLAGIAACGGGSGHNNPPIDAPAGNPAILYLAPDQGETHVKLVDTEPPPY
jgi:hypothetical protein